jgi:hypothetical protein
MVVERASVKRDHGLFVVIQVSHRSCPCPTAEAYSGLRASDVKTRRQVERNRDSERPIESLTDVLGDHKRHVIVESTAGPLRELAEGRPGELFGRRALVV